ncbi:MAG: cytochrome c [Gammaproteobacteria bacterium]|nr:cytochrome c [Gammaproteobacteria bacterium]
MKRFRIAALVTALALAGMPFLAIAEGEIEAGRAKAYTCLGCHGVDGYRNAYPSYRVPLLGGQHAAYIADALRAYQTGDRQHPTMRALAATLSEQDIQDIAAYFESSGANR